MEHLTGLFDEYGPVWVLVGVLLGILIYITRRLAGPNGIIERWTTSQIRQSEERNKQDADWQRNHDEFAERHDKALGDHAETSLSALAEHDRRSNRYIRRIMGKALDVVECYLPQLSQPDESAQKAIAKLRTTIEAGPPESDSH